MYCTYAIMYHGDVFRFASEADTGRYLVACWNIELCKMTLPSEVHIDTAIIPVGD